jgi:hypothetical protein
MTTTDVRSRLRQYLESHEDLNALRGWVLPLLCEADKYGAEVETLVGSVDYLIARHLAGLLDESSLKADLRVLLESEQRAISVRTDKRSVATQAATPERTVDPAWDLNFSVGPLDIGNALTVGDGIFWSFRPDCVCARTAGLFFVQAASGSPGVKPRLYLEQPESDAKYTYELRPMQAA